MNKIQKKKIIYSAILYAVLFGLMIFASVNGGVYDLALDKVLYRPDLSFPKFFEDFGQAVAWAMWGPAFAVIFLCRRDLNGCLGVINKIVPKITPVENVKSKAYKFFDFLVKLLESVGFFVLCTIGWKKLIENVIKNILKNAGKDNLSQAVYFLISFCVAVLSVIIFSRLDKKILKKLEGIALAGVLLGVLYKVVEECKTITHRVRFREMIAYSNGFFNEEGLSEGRYSPLTREMIDTTDFGAFTPWYRKSFSEGIYNYRLFNRTDSFPSGHTTSSCTVFLSVIFCSAFEKLKKFSGAVWGTCVVYVGVMGYTRLVRGAHYLSDVVGAFIIAYTLFLIVDAVYGFFSKKNILS